VKEYSPLADWLSVNKVMSPTWMSSQSPISAPTDDQRARGFTLVELLIIVSILGILAALAVPMMATSSDQARTEAVASNVSHIRAMIAYHSGAGGSSMTATGHPTTVDAAWFRDSKMPEHAFAGAPMIVQVVSLASNVVFPAVKSFNPLTIGATNAWYNSTNGEFCVLVPAKTSDAETVALFNAANKVSAMTISATTN
jgi:prepilin-type N-terminal cleavage/methylation domain-containing protein